MRLRGTSAWQINVNQWDLTYNLPLWVRAAERVDAAGALVPGPLDIDAVPRPTPSGLDGHRARQRADELAEGWMVWWETAIHQPPPDPALAMVPVAEMDGVLLRAPDLSFMAPDFDGLRRWPFLREVARARWLEGHQWSGERKRAGVRRRLPLRPDNGRVVADVERALGRPVRPFLLELIVLPVRDEQVRRVTDARYLVPERVYEGPGWPDLLQRMVVRLDG